MKIRSRRLIGLGVIATSFMLATTVAGRRTNIQPQETLAVWDSEGRRVGNVMGFVGVPTERAYPAVALRVDGSLVILSIGRDGAIDPPLGGVVGIGLYFEYSDCSGTPFLASGALFPEPPSSLPPAYLFGQQVFASTGPPQTFMVRAIKGEPLNPSECVSFDATEVFTVQLRSLIDLTTAFTPPFTVH